MTLPTLTVEIGHLTGWTLGITGKSELGTTTTLASMTFDNITSKVRSLSIRRGRNHELDRVEAGTASVRLLNQDGAFNPTNTTSSYYPNIRPMIPLRIRAIFDDFPTLSTSVAMRYDFSDVATLWKDTARTSPVTADGDVVLGVSDKSANARHLASPAADGPTYKVAIQNSKSVARFTGNAGRLDSGVLTLSQPTTIFLVTTNIGATAAQENIVSNAAGNQNTLYIAAGASSVASIYAGTVQSSATVVDDGVARIWAAEFNGASSFLYLNGGSTVIAANAGAEGIGTLRLSTDSAAAQDYVGDIGEVVIYNSALSLADINTIGAYLGTKWGITWTTAI